MSRTFRNIPLPLYKHRGHYYDADFANWHNVPEHAKFFNVYGRRLTRDGHWNCMRVPSWYKRMRNQDERHKARIAVRHGAEPKTGPRSDKWEYW